MSKKRRGIFNDRHVGLEVRTGLTRQYLLGKHVCFVQFYKQLHERYVARGTAGVRIALYALSILYEGNSAQFFGALRHARNLTQFGILIGFDLRPSTNLYAFFVISPSK